MNRIKKQFKDFCNYYKLTRCGVNSDGNTIRSYIPVYLCTIVGILLAYIQFMVSRGENAFSLSLVIMFLPFICGMVIGTGMINNRKTSLLSVSLFSPTQRIVFSYITTFVRALVFFVLYLVMFFAIFFIIGCIISLFVGEFVFVVEEDYVSPIARLSPYASAFKALFSVMYVFALMAICNMPRTKYRNVAALSFSFGVLVYSCIITNVCGYAMQEENNLAFFFMIDINSGLAALKYPWIVIVVQGVLALIAIAVSLYTTIKCFKSSEI